MHFQPLVATVVRSERISPSFQRVTFAGVDEMGPAGDIWDLRIKLLIPGPSGLPQLNQVKADFASWYRQPEEVRGALRTYSVRNLRRHDDGDELDVDFVLHPNPDGKAPASDWAASARPGDQIVIFAPDRHDNSGAGIEFNPREANSVELYGDETALPAMLQILNAWPADVRGTLHIELPHLDDRQDVELPAGVQINWHQRDGEHGDCLFRQLATRLGVDPPHGCAPDSLTGNGLIWETPTYSAAGEQLDDDSCEGCYFWIAGKSDVVTTMRRMLVGQAGVPRTNVSFMGYWK